ncbi:hypothetical protein FHR34_003816 [Kitasatospora kifunensis]|uniref:Uncharacterized protein n=1 Tax=Kitasatospora kifunensis TaxID=58351 RepID=A0A7W7VWC5_KITKI|nr:hypothetical protein [Kitasatospora kifunensis]
MGLRAAGPPAQPARACQRTPGAVPFATGARAADPITHNAKGLN